MDLPNKHHTHRWLRMTRLARGMAFLLCFGIASPLIYAQSFLTADILLEIDGMRTSPLVVQTNNQEIRFDRKAILHILSKHITPEALADLSQNPDPSLSSETLLNKGYRLNLDLFNLTCKLQIPDYAKPVQSLSGVAYTFPENYQGSTVLNGFINVFTEMQYERTQDTSQVSPAVTGLSSLQYGLTSAQFQTKIYPSPELQDWNITLDNYAEDTRWAIGTLLPDWMLGDTQIAQFSGLTYIQNSPILLPFRSPNTYQKTTWSLDELSTVTIQVNESTVFSKTLPPGNYSFPHPHLALGFNTITTTITNTKGTETRTETRVFHFRLIPSGDTAKTAYIGQATLGLISPSMNSPVVGGSIGFGLDDNNSLLLSGMGYDRSVDMGTQLLHASPLGLWAIGIGQAWSLDSYSRYLSIGLDALFSKNASDFWQTSATYRGHQNTNRFPELDIQGSHGKRWNDSLSTSLAAAYTRYTDGDGFTCRLSAICLDLPTTPEFTVVFQDPRLNRETFMWEIAFKLDWLSGAKSRLRQNGNPNTTTYTTDYQSEQTYIGNTITYQNPRTFDVSARAQYRQNTLSALLSKRDKEDTKQLFFRQLTRNYDLSGVWTSQSSLDSGTLRYGTALAFVGDSWTVSRPIYHNFIMFVPKHQNQQNNTLIVGNEPPENIQTPYILSDLSPYQTLTIPWLLVDKNGTPLQSQFAAYDVGFRSGQRVVIDGAGTTCITIRFVDPSGRPIDLAKGTLQAGNPEEKSIPFFTNEQGITYVYGAKLGQRYTLVLPGFTIPNAMITVPENTGDTIDLGTYHISPYRTPHNSL